MAAIPEMEIEISVTETSALDELKKYCEEQREGIVRHSQTAGGSGAMQAFGNVIRKIDELQKRIKP